jgi:hypothetical protein
MLVFGVLIFTQCLYSLILIAQNYDLDLSSGFGSKATLLDPYDQ